MQGGPRESDHAQKSPGGGLIVIEPEESQCAKVRRYRGSVHQQHRVPGNTPVRMILTGILREELAILCRF